MSMLAAEKVIVALGLPAQAAPPCELERLLPYAVSIGPFRALFGAE